MNSDSFEMLQKFGLGNQPNLKYDRIDIGSPRWDETSYWGRLRHFGVITNPANIFFSNQLLAESKQIVDKYKSGQDIPHLTLEGLWRAKYVVESAYHPETGEKMYWFGRMCAQVPCGMTLTGAMMAFIATRNQIIFTQWCNQSFNAFVNYTNRSSSKPVGITEMIVPYLSATSAALTLVVVSNALAKKAPSLIKRWVPFLGVAGANFVNIPLVRMSELQNGVGIVDSKGAEYGQSKVAAKRGIGQVLISRTALIAPAMIIIPIIMERLEKKPFLQKFPKLSPPLQILLCGAFLCFTVPASCAIFPQRATIQFSDLEPGLREQIVLENPEREDLKQTTFYFNKGL